MEASPLCDGARFTQNLEQAYGQMWRHWVEEQALEQNTGESTP